MRCYARLLTTFDCTAMWVKCSERLVDALSVTPEYLRSKEYDRRQVSDFRDWQVQHSRARRFDAAVAPSVPLFGPRLGEPFVNPCNAGLGCISCF